MRKDRHFQFLDYVPSIVAFLAAVAAVIGSPKWAADALGLAKVTPFGWTVLAIGFLALSTSILVTSRNKREQAKQKKTKERIAAIGIGQLLKAFQHAVHPIISDSIWRRQCKPLLSPMDLLDSERRRILASLDLNCGLNAQRMASKTVVFVESPLPIRQKVFLSGRSQSSWPIPLKFKIFSFLIVIAFPYACCAARTSISQAQRAQPCIYLAERVLLPLFRRTIS